MDKPVESQLNHAFKRVYSQAPWEELVGYCRALQAGSHIYVTGTVALDDNGEVYCPGDGYAQASRCLLLIERALQQLNYDRKAIVRTRMFVTDISKWRDFGKAHSEFFGQDRPTTSMLQISRLINSDLMIEIEADAFTNCYDSAPNPSTVVE